MQGIYNYIPKTNRVSSVYSISSVLYLKFVLHVMLLRPWNAYVFYYIAVKSNTELIIVHNIPEYSLRISNLSPHRLPLLICSVLRYSVRLICPFNRYTMAAHSFDPVHENTLIFSCCSAWQNFPTNTGSLNEIDLNDSFVFRIVLLTHRVP